MAYERLLQQGLIRSYRAKPQEVDRLLQVAARDLSTAGKILSDDADWAFNIVYNGASGCAGAGTA